MTSANINDLRSYLTLLEEAGELSRVSVPVSLDQEIGAICLRNLRASGLVCYSNGPVIAPCRSSSTSWRHDGVTRSRSASNQINWRRNGTDAPASRFLRLWLKKECASRM